MQKRANRVGWQFVAGAMASAALTALYSVAGFEVSAGSMVSSGPVIGDKPTTGLRGANDGEQHLVGCGPVEHQ